MTTPESIQLFVALNLLVIGISHLLRPDIWIEFFTFLHRKGQVGNIVNALLALAMGSIIVSFHLIWEWPVVLVTVYGLLQLLKGFIYLIFPEVGLKSIGKVNAAATKFRWTGLLLSLLSLALIYYLFV